MWLWVLDGTCCKTFINQLCYINITTCNTQSREILVICTVTHFLHFFWNYGDFISMPRVPWITYDSKIFSSEVDYVNSLCITYTMYTDVELHTDNTYCITTNTFIIPSYPKTISVESVFLRKTIFILIKWVIWVII